MFSAFCMGPTGSGRGLYAIDGLKSRKKSEKNKKLGSTGTAELDRF